ncbi:hypothetical protein BJ912DRAFT_930939 [Pholiota molesta]|nr:hypothetical protein BJ912DRAFT_930939 [Pholiota molesta]
MWRRWGTFAVGKGIWVDDGDGVERSGGGRMGRGARRRFQTDKIIAACPLLREGSRVDGKNTAGIAFFGVFFVFPLLFDAVLASNNQSHPCHRLFISRHNRPHRHAIPLPTYVHLASSSYGGWNRRTRAPPPAANPHAPRHHQPLTSANAQPTPPKTDAGWAAEGDEGTVEDKDRPHKSRSRMWRRHRARCPRPFQAGKAPQCCHVSTPTAVHAGPPNTTPAHTRHARRPSSLPAQFGGDARARRPIQTAIHPSRGAISAYAAPSAFSCDPHTYLRSFLNASAYTPGAITTLHDGRGGTRMGGAHNSGTNVASGMTTRIVVVKQLTRERWRVSLSHHNTVSYVLGILQYAGFCGGETRSDGVWWALVDTCAPIAKSLNCLLFNEVPNHKNVEKAEKTVEKDLYCLVKQRPAPCSKMGNKTNCSGPKIERTNEDRNCGNKISNSASHSWEHVI